MPPALGTGGLTRQSRDSIILYERKAKLYFTQEGWTMREEYDFSRAKKNPYTKLLKKPVTTDAEKIQKNLEKGLTIRG